MPISCMYRMLFISRTLGLWRKYLLPVLTVFLRNVQNSPSEECLNSPLCMKSHNPIYIIIADFLACSLWIKTLNFPVRRCSTILMQFPSYFNEVAQLLLLQISAQSSPPHPTYRRLLQGSKHLQLQPLAGISENKMFRPQFLSCCSYCSLMWTLWTSASGCWT